MGAADHNHQQQHINANGMGVAAITANPNPRQRRTRAAVFIRVWMALLKRVDDATTRLEFSNAINEFVTLTPPGKTAMSLVPTEELGETDEWEVVDGIDMDANVVGAFQPSAPYVDDFDRLFRRLDKHIKVADMSKARQATKPSAHADIANPVMLQTLLSKYLASEQPLLPRTGQDDEYSQVLMPERQIISNIEGLVAHINGKKHGASCDVFGISNDHYKQLLVAFPEEAPGLLMRVLNKIACGNLLDTAGRAAMVTVKGTALLKPPNSIRPVGTATGLMHLTGHCLATEYHDRIQAIVGKEQLMGVSSGCEVLIHLLRTRLLKEPTKVVAKVDCRNAYNDIEHAAMLEIVSEELRELLSYVEMLLTMTPLRTVYRDRASGKTVVMNLDRGTPQGGSLSTTLYCLGQAKTMREAKLRHPNVQLYLIADDIHVFGEPSEVIDAILTVRTLIAEIGLSLADTTADKNVIFGFGDYSAAMHDKAESANLHWISATGGLKVGGAPIGSQEYMIEFVNKIADDILSELDLFVSYTNKPNADSRNTVQTMFGMIRQCSTQQLMHLLRSVPPSATKHAARRVDCGIANAILAITNSVKYLPPSDSEKMQVLLNKLFLNLRKGGFGLINAEVTRTAAYVASVAEAAPRMRELCPTVGLMNPAIPAPSSLVEFETALHALLQDGNPAVSEIDTVTMWDAPQVRKLQHNITDVVQNKRQEDAQRALPVPPPAAGLGVFLPLSADDAAILRQGIADAGPDSGAVFSANSAFKANKMTDAAFCTTFHLRGQIPVMGNCTHCQCGAVMDCNGDHGLVCPVMGIRNRLRNPMHAAFSKCIKEIAARLSAVGEYTVGTGEPLVEQYLSRKVTAAPPVVDAAAQGAAPPPAVDDDQWRQTADVRGQTNKRADVVLSYNSGDCVKLVDVMFAATNSKLIKDYRAGKAAVAGAKAKLATYAKEFKLQNTAGVELVLCVAEPSGALAPEARKFLRQLAEYGSNPIIEYGQILRTLSVHIHTARAKMIHEIITRYSSYGPPTMPFVSPPPRTLPPVLSPPPPLPIIVQNRAAGRRNAVAPPRRRPRAGVD